MKRLIALVFTLLSPVVCAHDLFLNAHPFRLEKPGSLELAMNLAESFPGKEEVWRKDKTVQFWLIGPAGERKLQAEKGKNPTIQLSEEGTYVIGWNASPSYIEIDSEHFNEYIEVEGYRNVVEARKKEGKENAQGREKYVRFLKAFVQAGSKLTQHYAQVLGQKIEIVPQSNPYSLKRGSELIVKVVYDGKPLTGARVMSTYDTYSKEHDVYAHTTDTADDGTAKIPITQDGIWMIRVNTMLSLEGDPKADWQSYWANCSFQVH